MRLAHFGRLPTQTVSGTWYRALHTAYRATPLAYAHTAAIPGRFNAGSTHRPGFPVLYCCDSRFVAQFEVGALLGSPGAFVPYATTPWFMLDLTVSLSRVVDLTRPARRRRIATTAQELTGDWREYARRPSAAVSHPYWTHVPTQKLGAALHAIPGVEGILTYSAKVPSGRNLVVFPTKLGPKSSVTFVDSKTGLTYSIP